MGEKAFSNVSSIFIRYRGVCTFDFVRKFEIAMFELHEIIVLAKNKKKIKRERYLYLRSNSTFSRYSRGVFINPVILSRGCTQRLYLRHANSGPKLNPSYSVNHIRRVTT